MKKDINDGWKKRKTIREAGGNNGKGGRSRENEWGVGGRSKTLK